MLWLYHGEGGQATGWEKAVEENGIGQQSPLSAQADDEGEKTVELALDQ